MSKAAIYPGSFSPWHSGHSDVLHKALRVFDRVVIAPGRNFDKINADYKTDLMYEDFKEEYNANRVVVMSFAGLLVDHIAKVNELSQLSAVIRGLRNGTDLQYETVQQYWNEDLGLKIPVVYFVCDRALTHISSSAIRMIESIKRDDRWVLV